MWKPTFSSCVCYEVRCALCAALYARYENHAVLVPKMFVSVVFLLCLNGSRNVFVISLKCLWLWRSLPSILFPPFLAPSLPPALEVRGQMDQVIGSRRHLYSITYRGQHFVFLSVFRPFHFCNFPLSELCPHSKLDSGKAGCINTASELRLLRWSACLSPVNPSLCVLCVVIAVLLPLLWCLSLLLSDPQSQHRFCAPAGQL